MGSQTGAAPEADKLGTQPLLNGLISLQFDHRSQAPAWERNATRSSCFDTFLSIYKTINLDRIVNSCIILHKLIIMVSDHYKTYSRAE